MVKGLGENFRKRQSKFCRMPRWTAGLKCGQVGQVTTTFSAGLAARNELHLSAGPRLSPSGYPLILDST